MRYIAFFSFIFCCLFLEASEPEADKIPKKIRESIPELALYLTDGLGTDREKVQALYKWVTNNIAYDYEATKKKKVGFFEGPEKVLKDEKAICGGYVYLLGAMLDEIGITWEEVSGYTNSPSPYFIPSVVLDDHAWIAIKLDGTWMLADPTWDAGYVGALSKESKVPSLEKQQKNIEKIKKMNRKLRAKGRTERKVPEIDTIPEKTYTGKVGFVKKPGETWFLVSSDSFLTRHLPSNPMWQLRHDTIGVRDFIQGPKRVKMFSNRMYEESFYPYEEVIAHYMSLDYLGKQMFLGEDAIAYFSNNTRAKATKYFRFLQVLNNKEMQKYIKNNIPAPESRGMYKQMQQVMDTTLSYMDISEQSEKIRNREWNSFYRQAEKKAQKNDDYYSNMLDKSQDLHDKIEDKYKKELDRIDKERLKAIYLKKKIKKLNPEVLQYDANSKVPQGTELLSSSWQEILKVTQQFNTLDSSWTARINTPGLVSIDYTNQYNLFLLKQRKAAIEQKYIELNSFIDTVDARLLDNYTRIEELYTDSLDAEIFPKEFYQYCKQLESLSKIVTDEVNLLRVNEEIANPNELLEHVNGLVFSYYQRFEKNILAAQEHQSWVLTNLPQVEKSWKNLAKITKEQEKLNKDKMKFLMEEEEISHERELSLSETITEQTEKWMKEIEKRYN